MVTNSNTSNSTKQHHPERLLRWPEVKARVGFCKSYSYVLQKKGLFPKSIKFTEGGRAVGYLESEINEFINNRIAQSRKEKTNETS
jgi:prophage regulatory protein